MIMSNMIILIRSLQHVCSLSSRSSGDTNKTDREKRKGYTELKVYEIDEENKRLIQHDVYDIEGNVVTRTIEERGPDPCHYKPIYKYVESNKYNENNMLIESSRFNVCGFNNPFITIKYNENNVMTEKVIKHFDGGNSYEQIYKYDDKGNVISITSYINHKLIELSYSNQYNDKNQLIEKKGINKYYYNDGELEETNILTITTTYIYDGKGNKISETELRIDEEEEVFSEVRNYKYNDKGLLIESPEAIVPEYRIILFEYLGWNSLDNYYFKYKYNEKGLIVEQETVHKEYGTEQLTKYKYNDKDLVIETTVFNSEGNPICIFVYEYK